MIAARRPPERLPLEPLDRDELADLIEAIEGERPTGSGLVLVAERSRGIPLVAEELLAARRELSRSSLPVSLEDLVIARLGAPLAGVPAGAPPARARRRGRSR